MYGLPYFVFCTEISLKFSFFLNPVPKALENASFAANFLEKKDVLFEIFF